ncbi:hypothetical protein V476_00510, partial [Pseudomonas syringae KCTC 12500]
HEETSEVPVMITKHCLRFSFNLCPKQAKGVTGVRTKVAPMQLVHGDEVLTLKFDCKPCEMHVIGKMKGHILDLPLPGSAAAKSVVATSRRKTCSRLRAIVLRTDRLQGVGALPAPFCLLIKAS